MQRRQINMEDGRYLIFYTFEEAATASGHPEEAGSSKAGSGAVPEIASRPAEPNAEPQAEEERRV